MTFPGQNQFTLNKQSIMRIVQERLNSDITKGAAIIRVTDVKFSYQESIEFTITTDPLPASDTITTTED